MHTVFGDIDTPGAQNYDNRTDAFRQLLPLFGFDLRRKLSSTSFLRQTRCSWKSGGRASERQECSVVASRAWNVAVRPPAGRARSRAHVKRCIKITPAPTKTCLLPNLFTDAPRGWPRDKFPGARLSSRTRDNGAQ